MKKEGGVRAASAPNKGGRESERLIKEMSRARDRDRPMLHVRCQNLSDKERTRQSSGNAESFSNLLQIYQEAEKMGHKSEAKSASFNRHLWKV